MRGKNPAVLDVELLNPYNGIDATRNERHLIRNVQGQPIRRGVWVDQIYDVGRIENRGATVASTSIHGGACSRGCSNGRWSTARRSSSDGATGNTC